MVPRPEGVIDQEDDWEEMSQLEGLGQGEGAVTFVSFHHVLCSSTTFMVFAAFGAGWRGTGCGYLSIEAEV
jgi:hypothetical protein